jgi:benzoylformate decarboxylase
VPTVREVTHDVMRTLGLTTTFGNPGSTELPFLTRWPADFRYVLALQEASAVGMADGYALASDRAAHVNLHTGPGMGNAMGNLETAFYNRAPLLVSVGQQVRPMLALRPLLTNDSPLDLPRPYAKQVLEPARAEDVPLLFQQAWHLAMQAPRGPVVISIPMDDWDVETTAHEVRPERSWRSAPDPSALAGWTRELGAAQRPALVLGAGVDASGGWDDAVALAERLGAAVFTAPNSSRCPFPENHPLYQGQLPMAMGPLGERLGAFDVVLVAGAQVFLYYPHAPGPVVPPGTCLLHVTDDPLEAARAPVGESLVADPALTLAALVESLPPGKPAVSPPRRPAPEAATPTSPISAAWLFTCVADALPEGTVLVEENTSARKVIHERIRVRRPDGYFTTGSGGLGYGLPAAVGVALAHEQGDGAPVCLLIGDGSLHYSIQAFWTAATEQVPLVVVIADNGGYGILKSFAEFLGQRDGVPALDVPGLDHGAIAGGYGARVEHVTDADALPKQLSEAFVRALQERCPVVVHVPVDATVEPLL